MQDLLLQPSLIVKEVVGPQGRLLPDYLPGFIV